MHNKLIEDLKKSALFKVLPRTPIAAIILAKILQESRDELPSNLTELYTQYIELSLGRWDIRKGLANHKEYEASVAILTEMAKYLLDNALSALSRAKRFRCLKGILRKEILTSSRNICFIGC